MNKKYHLGKPFHLPEKYRSRPLSRIVGTRADGSQVITLHSNPQKRTLAFTRLSSGSFVHLDIIPSEVRYIRKEAERGGYDYHKASNVFRELDMQRARSKERRRVWVTPKKK